MNDATVQVAEAVATLLRRHDVRSARVDRSRISAGCGEATEVSLTLDLLLGDGEGIPALGDLLAYDAGSVREHVVADLRRRGLPVNEADGTAALYEQLEVHLHDLEERAAEVVVEAARLLLAVLELGELLPP